MSISEAITAVLQASHIDDQNFRSFLRGDDPEVVAMRRALVQLADAVRDEDETDHEKEAKRLRDGIDYWSYCMSQGMLNTCPEKVEQLAEFLISCRVSPWYIRNSTLETLPARPLI